MRTKYEHLSKLLQVGVLPVEHPVAEMLGLRSLTAGGGNVMNAWSEYLRGQAVIADRYAKTMTTAATVKEFTDIAESFRHDADLEDENPTCTY
jgi:hypothetical protein